MQRCPNPSQVSQRPPGLVEAEAPGRKTGDLGVRQVCVELAHQVEDAHDGGRGGARGVADGGLGRCG